MANWFRKFAHLTSSWAGSSYSFLGACLIILVWALTGHVFHYSDTWQLIINTGTTIITFLMVFLIQNTQNRDAREIHIKIDELIRATKDARNKLINLEDLSDDELDHVHKELCAARDQNVERINEIAEHRKRRHSQKTNDKTKTNISI